MAFRFAGHELDLDRRELRRDGAPVHIEPKVLELLAYLVARRDRAVSKRELLDALWPDVVVTEGSLQRVVSLARAAFGEGRNEIVRTLPRYGYRFVAALDEAGAGDPARASAVRWARAGDVHVASRTLGPEGSLDLVVVNGWSLPMSACLEHPRIVRNFEAMARAGRVILFDKRGVGLSDRVRRATLEERMDDLRCVLDAAGSSRAIVIGFSEGAPMAILFAATFPERTLGLVLVGAFARFTASADHPRGWSAEQLRTLRAYVSTAWGAGATARQILAPEDTTSEEVRAWSQRAELLGASPGAALDLLAMNEAIDARGVLGCVHVPTIVLHQTGDRVIDVENGRALARAIPGARLVEIAGEDHGFVHHGTEHVLAAIETIASGAATPSAATPSAPGFLATVLHAIAADPGSGDAAWDALVACRPRCRVRADAGALWACFESAGAALRAASVLHAACAGQGAQIACGIDASEITLAGERVSGPAVERSVALARVAEPGTTRCSALVAALVHDPALTFARDGETCVVRRQT